MSEWITPPMFINELGPFDLDPCAAVNQPWPCAKESITIDRDGLKVRWYGNIWLHPPPDPPQLEYTFVKKLARHGKGILLIPAKTESKVFHEQIFPKCTALYFLRRRIKFFDVTGNKSANNFRCASILVAFGVGNADRLRNLKKKCDGFLIDSQ